jgi:hypothetical protein
MAIYDEVGIAVSVMPLDTAIESPYALPLLRRGFSLRVRSQKRFT